MPFFMFKHYSTAEKIIAIVEEKLKSVLAISRYCTGSSVVNEKKLSEVVGSLLKDNLPDFLYKKYQALNASEKNKIRELIANDYFRNLKDFTQDFRTLKIFSRKIDGGRFDDLVYKDINLPPEFFDKKWLGKKLQDSLSSIKSMINKTVNESMELKPM